MICEICGKDLTSAGILGDGVMEYHLGIHLIEAVSDLIDTCDCAHTSQTKETIENIFRLQRKLKK